MPRVIIPGRINNSNVSTGKQFRNLNYSNEAQERYMTLRSKGITDVVLAYAPKETAHSSMSLKWDEIQRSGQDPIIVASGIYAERMSFECVLAASQPDNITAGLQALRKMARSRDPVTISYTSWEGAGFWRISDMSVDIINRSSIDHSPTYARVSLEMISLPGSSSNGGMISGGAPTNAGSTGSKGTMTYVIRNGDTLWAIAQKFYGNGEKWTVIAKENNLTHPKAQLKGGRSTLRIPSLK